MFYRATVALLLLIASSLAVADSPAPNRDVRVQLKGGVGSRTLSGYVGGEAHDRYSINVKAGRTLTVELAPAENRADLMVSETREFGPAEPVTFGSSSNEGKSWSGQVPRTGDYFVFITAHPDARYKLTFQVK